MTVHKSGKARLSVRLPVAGTLAAALQFGVKTAQMEEQWVVGSNMYL
jgi:hypothetical protein